MNKLADSRTATRWSTQFLAELLAIVAMTAITAALTVPFAVTARRFAGANRALSMGTGLLSMAVGLFLVYRVGFV